MQLSANMGNRQAESPVMLGPRIPTAEPLGSMDAVVTIAVPNRVVEPRQESSSTSTSAATSSCSPNSHSNLCELPVSSSTFTMPIILGIVIPLVAASILFIFLQRRHVRKQREEDANDQHADMDFGLGDVPQPGRRKRAPGTMDTAEKGGKHRQLSMDVAMNSPYLLPPELQQSRESLRSLSRNINPHEDPYHPVTQYYSGDGSSIRSLSRPGNEASSTYTSSSKAPSRLQDMNSKADLLSNASGMPKSNPPAAAFIPPPRQNSLPQKTPAMGHVEKSSEAQIPPPPPPPYPVEPQQAHIQDTNITRVGLPISPRPGQSLVPAPTSNDRESFQSNVDLGFRASNNYLGAFINGRDSSPSPPAVAPPASNTPAPIVIASPRLSPPVGKALPASPRPPRKDSAPSVAMVPKSSIDEGSDFGTGFQITPPSPPQNKAEIIRGQRYSMDVPPEEFAQAGLGAPGFDPRRLSMGFRPLPPPEAMDETEDPEIRANRIRSFYKEYFDESKPAPAGQYYEDYDQNYLGGDASYYEPNDNRYDMPYAEPIGRRAMTPPPRGPPRFQGQGQPRGRQGSVGAMSMGGRSQNGWREPQMYPPGPYPQGPRAYSSASGRSGVGPRRPMPPPAPLNTLPTPSKLRDDSFALLGAMEFAPPQSYRERAAGRSESPLGERRPYSPAVPAFVPTASAFDELAPVPSPHLLRRSGTFTSLDFAPPKKFRDADTMSDAGSIRSNRSGVSQRTQGAIRNGAYRVSRLPQDMVPTKDDMSTQLKPQWGMRAGS